MIKQAGFYRELGGAGDQTTPAPSLRDAARGTGEWDEGRILAYLDSGHEIYTTMGAERDVIADDVWITGAGSLVTDGTWLWPAELAYYVRRHHVALLPEFVAHIRAQNYISPDVPREQAVAIFDEHFGENARIAAAADVAATQGVFAWYQPSLTRASAQGLINQLSASGLAVAHPLTDNLFGFRETQEGKKQPLMGGPDTLVTSLADSRYRTVEFQCWMGYDQSLAAAVGRIDDSIQKITFQISDVPEPDREEAVAALVRTLDQDVRDCLGFVIDRTGTSGGQDWDGVLVGTGAQFMSWPDTLGIRRDRLPTQPMLAVTESTDYGPLVVFHRPEPRLGSE